MHHPCVLRLISWDLPPAPAPGAIRTEYASNRSVKDVLEKANARSPPSFWTLSGRAIIIAGIVFGMRYVHSKKIVHRDLKPANILINGSGHALIGDFGASRLQSGDQNLTGESGTINYAAPELFRDDMKCSTKSDVFSFGYVAYEILTGSPVFFYGEPPYSVMKRLFDGDLPQLPEKHGAMMKELIKSCWETDPEKRPSFDAILAEFRKYPHQIVPEANPSLVDDYIRKITSWESRHDLFIAGDEKC
jgi:serine/threonine protein kinase